MPLTLLRVGALSTLIAFPPHSQEPRAFAYERAVIQLRVEIEQQETLATAVLIHREDRPQGVVLYFLTSAGLLRPAHTSPPTRDPAGEGDMEVQNTAVDIAVLRILIETSSLAPADVALDPPEPGASFFIVSRDATGVRIVVPQHIGRISARQAVGDLALPADACVGAPAFSDKGAFGIVTECERNRPPVVTLLSAARGLLRRLIPGLDLGQEDR